MDDKGLAEAASSMAFRMWHAEHSAHPKVSEKAEFLALVDLCVKALSGKSQTRWDCL